MNETQKPDAQVKELMLKSAVGAKQLVAGKLKKDTTRERVKLIFRESDRSWSPKSATSRMLCSPCQFSPGWPRMLRLQMAGMCVRVNIEASEHWHLYFAKGLQGREAGPFLRRTRSLLSLKCFRKQMNKNLSQ